MGQKSSFSILEASAKKKSLKKKKKIVVISAHLYHLERGGQFLCILRHFYSLYTNCCPASRMLLLLRELLKPLSLVLQKNDCISFKADLGLSNVIHLGVFPCFFFPSVKSSLARQGLCTESRTEGT